MKTSTIICIICLLLGTGCASGFKSSYVPVTPNQIDDKIIRNDTSRDYAWNRWNYAGSDEQYDYVYEYIPGSLVPYGFRYYKLPVGSLDVYPRYGFDPDYGDNSPVFQ